MSALSQFLGNLAGQVAARAIIPRILGATGAVGRMEPGRYPHPEYGPVIIPAGAEMDRPDAPAPPRLQIATWAVFAAYGGLLWYAAKKTAPTPLADLPEAPEIPDLGDVGVTAFEEETPLLFPGLKRELDLESEDIATSDDPVLACLERAGWKLNRVEKLRESIFEKQQLDMFGKPLEDLTRSEEELLEAINTCLAFLEGKFGSLEAAGVACGECSGDDSDLGATQEELTLYPGPTAPKHMRAKEGPDTFWFFIAKGHRKANPVTQDQIDANPDWYLSAEKDKKGKLYQVEADTKVKALTKLHDQLKAAREYTKEYGGKENKFTPWFSPVESGGKGYRTIPNVMAHPKTAEQAEIDFDPAPDPRKIPRDRIEFLLNQYLEGLESGQHPTIDGATLHIYGRTGKEYREALLGSLRSWGFKNWTNFKASMKSQSRYAKDEVALLYEYLDSLEPGEKVDVLDAVDFIIGGNPTSEKIDAVNALVKQEGYYYLDDLRKAYKSGDEEKIPAHRKTRTT